MPNSSNTDCHLLSLDFDPIPLANLPTTVAPTWIVLCVIHTITAPVIFGVNLLIIWSICEDSCLRNSSYNILISVLATTDLLVGLVVQPTFISLLICLFYDCSLSCQLGTAYIVTAFVCCGWSIVSLTLISLERYLAIEHPLSYPSIVNIPRTISITIFTLVVCPATLVALRFHSNSSFAVRQLPPFLLISTCCLVIIFCVGKVFRTTRRHRMSIAIQAAAVVPMEDVERARLRRRELKRYFTLGIILLATVVLFLPLLVIKVLMLSLEKDFTQDFKYISQFIFASCIYFQSLVNPIVVALRLSYVRKKVFQKLCCKRNVVNLTVEKQNEIRMSHDFSRSSYSTSNRQTLQIGTRTT